MFDNIARFVGIKALAASVTSGSKRLFLKPGQTAEIKAKEGTTAVRSYQSAKKVDKTQLLKATDRRIASTDISRLSRTQSTKTLIRTLCKVSPDISAAAFTYIRTAITSDYKVVAYNMDGTVNTEATAYAIQVMKQLDYLPDYSVNKFTGTLSSRSISESWAYELLIEGSCAGELVLGPGYVPQRINPISTSQIQFYPDADGFKPVQKIGQDEIKLDIPTFFYVAADQDLLDPYSNSPLESAVKPVMFGEQVLADITRVMRRAIHPRIVVTVKEEHIQATMPPTLVTQEEKDAYRNGIIDEITQRINDLEPEDALVLSNMLDVRLENNGNSSISSEYSEIRQTSNAKVSTGAKVLPAVLGHGQGSNVASTEAMLFMKAADGVREKLNEMYSRILTLTTRLAGQEVYVKFTYDPINLRPEDEVEGFKAQKQSRILDLLSLGLISDEEACLTLTHHLPPEGYTPLSGTRFRDASRSHIMKNPYSGETNSGSTLNQHLAPDTPSQTRGSRRKEGTNG